ncbi:hypothetical protein P4637_19570 [Halalkalibacterium halodurans]|jgi:hypothetical protein|uniref:BH2355 protein n=2 Tax=Halalkalibacterium halodurans TaxID=86665 RepID=Q9KAD4_HALH5|nr:hypothetical protein [Halalkalibacterium halodurans]MDY7222904.1 hypothetical protein [Halalkalibacterium halodurans]MDY7242125.1 hypothetical protein [Halalkalibacterium halodurans]MED3648498.1 hypothetical protein [Halalkalibacterium halodurans]MED4081184.1 hypothetical protein [Halalkalibacterium halodurans]MED4087019.1 hypothetical protein [Halalkalibacterium halodurans]
MLRRLSGQEISLLVVALITLLLMYGTLIFADDSDPASTSMFSYEQEEQHENLHGQGSVVYESIMHND